MFRALCLLLSLILVCPPAFAADGTSLVKFQINETNALDLITVQGNYTYSNTEAWTDGTGANQFQISFTDQRTTDSTGEDLDLAGVLKDGFGRVLTFTAIKAISIEASSTNTQTVNVGAGTHPLADIFGATADFICIPAGGTFTIVNPSAAGWPVTATSADDLGIKASTGGGSVTYKIVIIGEGSGA